MRVAFAVLAILFASTAVAQEPTPAPGIAGAPYPMIVRIADPAKLVEALGPADPGGDDRPVWGPLDPLMRRDPVWSTSALLPSGPVTIAFTKAELASATGGKPVTVFPVRDVDSALEALRSTAIDNEESGGILRLVQTEGTIFVRVDAPELIVGPDRDAVTAFDRHLVRPSPDPPRGALVAELDLEAIGPALDQVLERFAEMAGSSEAEVADSTAGLAAIIAGAPRVLLADATRMLMSIERVDTDLVTRLRIVPRPGSDLDALLLAQPDEFPGIARLVAIDDSAWLVQVAAIRLTPVVSQALRQVIAAPFGAAQSSFPQDLMLDCMRGEMINVVSIEEEGPAQTSIVALRRGPKCARLFDEHVTVFEKLLGSEAHAPSDWPAFHDDRVRAVGFGQSDVAISLALVEDLLVQTSGPRSRERLAEIVERRLGIRKSTAGIEPERFAPIPARGGLYVDTGSGAERFVLGVWAERGRLAIDIVLPASAMTAPEPAIWPPPPEPKAPATTSADLPRDETAPGLAGTGGVTNPRRISGDPPIYPELMRMLRLEARLIIQATITREGRVTDPTVLRCSGKSLDEEASRGPFDIASPFCSEFSAAAFAMLDGWLYEPARKDGEAVAVYFTIVVDFELK